MDLAQSVQVALQAANLALSGDRLKTGRGLASIELRDSGRRRPRFNWAAWEPGASLGIAAGAVALVVVCWFI